MKIDLSRHAFFILLIYLSIFPLKLLPQSECFEITSAIHNENIDFDTVDTYKLTLHPGWNWLSFPRLEREGDDPVLARPILDSIKPSPTQLSMLNRPLQEAEPQTYYIIHNHPDWSGNLDNVQSTFGYKLETNNEGISYLPMTGSVLDPETEITIYPGHENWVGYFLPETQSPFEAIPMEVIENLSYIKGQYWCCHKQGPPHTKNSGYIWACACEKGSIELKYSDMVILFEGTSAAQTFSWNRSESRSAIMEKDAPEFFQYKEQADYEAIFIELDSANIPDEIGAFAGDSCIGATKVLPDDTTALICAYTEGFEGEEITFELLYSTKSSGPVLNDYLVQNNQTGIREKRRIMIGEKQPYFIVSFHNSQDNSASVEPAWVHCVPNPARDETTVSYFIAGDTKVSIRLSNALGKEVMRWDQGMQIPGNYQLKFNTTNLPAGYYLVGLFTENQTSAEKLLIVH